MESSSMVSLMVIVLFSTLPLSHSQPALSYFVCNNSHGNYSSNSTYRTNLQTLLNSITSNTQIDNGFYNFSEGHYPNTVYGIGFCRFDYKVSDCRACLQDAAWEIPGNCPSQKEAIGYYDTRCMLRYTDRSIFKTMEQTPAFVQFSDEMIGMLEEKQFNHTLLILLEELKEKADRGDSRYKFATGSANPSASRKIYALTQCNPDLSSSNCSTCIQQSISSLASSYFRRTDAAIYGPSCRVQYGHIQFYNLASPTASPVIPSSTKQASSRKGSVMKKVWITFTLAALFMLLATISFWLLCLKKRKASKETDEGIGEITCVDPLQYDYKLIIAATNDFSEANRLDRGTSTSIYKGVLPSGQEIVVKKMLDSGTCSRLEFDNEVLLLSNLQHRNLLKLIGFCIIKDLRFIVYEFLPNGSLTQFFNDATKLEKLGWEARHKIILGVARGLLYLHEDSQLRVVHRDLKASNILLDAEMKPKIANFSQASRVYVDEPNKGSSKINGTYGHMAPECVLQGQYSVKSDVFSFGVLMLEIITGQTITDFSSRNNGQSLLSIAWRKWSKGEELQLMDKTIQGSQSYTDQIRNCIKVALLCVQEDPASRPTIFTSVFMLNSNTNNIPNPSAPGFTIDSEVPSSSCGDRCHQTQGSINHDSISCLDPR